MDGILPITRVDLGVHSIHASSCICALSAGVNTLEQCARPAGVDQAEVVRAPSQNAQGWSSRGSTYPGRRLCVETEHHIIMILETCRACLGRA